MTNTTVCFGSPASLAVAGAQSYTWTGPAGYTAYSAIASIPIANNNSVENYIVTGKGVNSCTSVATASLNTFPLPVISLSVPATGCVNSQVTFEASGGSFYQWTGPSGFNSTNKVVSFTAMQNSSGTYSITVKDVNSCKSATTIAFTVVNAPKGTLSNNTGIFCVPYCTNFKFVPAVNTASLTNFAWQIAVQTFTTQNFTYCFSKAGNYIVNGKITDINNCSTNMQYNLTAYQSPTANFVITPEKPTANFDQVIFKNSSEGEQINSFSWHFINNTGFKSSLPTTTYLFEASGSYPVALVVKNNFGCSDTVVKAIVVKNDFSLFVPTAFTPNFDGKNDDFKAKAINVETFNMTVFNRWGDKIFESSDILNGWNGTENGSNCKEDTYVWKIRATSFEGEIKELEGRVVLYR